MEYFISDLHFGHANIIPFSSRPFGTTAEMDKVIIERWNNKVKENDTVYILGDVSFYKKKDTKRILAGLNGNKILIKGNHDDDVPKECFMYVKDYHEIKLQGTGEKIVLCHYPILEWDGYFRCVKHFYGHVHNTRIIELPNCYNVGADILNFEPCTVEEVIERNRIFVEKYKDKQIYINNQEATELYKSKFIDSNRVLRKESE